MVAIGQAENKPCLKHTPPSSLTDCPQNGLAEANRKLLLSASRFWKRRRGFQVLQDSKRKTFAQSTCFIMQILLGYVLFTVLLRTGAAFQCIVCEMEGASTCTAEFKNCNAGENSCLRSLSEDVKGEKTQTKVVLDCAPSTHCNNQFIELSYEKGVYVRRQYDCCKTDKCNPPSTKMPTLNTTTNGKHCPVCSLETGRCSVDVPLECTGSAMYCFEATIKDATKKPVKGCTTESICNILKTYQGPLIGNLGIQDVTCQEAKSDSSCSSLAAFLLALLPMKLFLFSAY
ncbi:phospholipase A2 inhibitor and Ly6/PLAUR domain-containing protein-like [Ahaetulla prasina]|uniref:phospholipase A2 inhibitor and Ly6/PLAUR domain-containing protein-like n=1 Tax=Ahaetulla prasina TaxID=499056 RepID=UPI0026482776|nr:phospholipase A2 inhibitor and Ly6/PLAUR domain-containing protein-like [Ahaetulla prasina]